MFSELWGKISFWLVFVGFNVSFFPQFLLGTRGMPRRYYDYTRMLDEHPEFHDLHHLSTIGSYVLTVGMVLVLIYLIHSLLKGRLAPANPWGAATLEWRCSTPPPHDNFASPPTVGDPYDMASVRYDAKEEAFIPVAHRTDE